MKIYYFNDRRVSMVIRVQGFDYKTTDYILPPHSGSEYEVWIPRGHVLSIKEWDYSIVLISSTPKKLDFNEK